jgi:hypothetical protein
MFIYPINGTCIANRGSYNGCFSLILVKAIDYVFPESAFLLSHQRRYFAFSSRDWFLVYVSEFSVLKNFIHTFSLYYYVFCQIKSVTLGRMLTQFFFSNFEIVKIKHFPAHLPQTGFLFLNLALHVSLSVLLWGNTQG